MARVRVERSTQITVQYHNLADHPEQERLILSPAKRKIARSGRRGGKTIGASEIAVRAFKEGKRVQYGAPTYDQVESFWFEVKWMLDHPLRHGALYKHEGRRVIEVPGTKRCIRARTAHDPETWRGDYGDELIFDEWQNQKFEAWNEVGAPMLLDNNGNATFLYTAKRGAEGTHAREMFRRAEADTTGRWEAFHWASHSNPHISADAIEELVGDMSDISYRMEIGAEDLEDDPAALWQRQNIEDTRWLSAPTLDRIAIGVDPPGTSAECGIVVAGSARIHGELHAFVLEDATISGSPGKWGDQVAAVYNKWKAGYVIAEVNQGGDMVESTIHTSDSHIAVRKVRATRGKATRAEPIVAKYEKDLIHHVGTFGKLEDQMCFWVPGAKSPDRLDALVWVLSFLLLGPRGRAFGVATVTGRKGRAR